MAGLARQGQGALPGSKGVEWGGPVGATWRAGGCPRGHPPLLALGSMSMVMGDQFSFYAVCLVPNLFCHDAWEGGLSLPHLGGSPATHKVYPIFEK